MDIYQILIILSCISSTITMFLVVVAVLPHVKNGMALVRDTILWLAFVLVVALAGWLAWQRVAQRWPTATSRPNDRATFMQMLTSSMHHDANSKATDPFYREP